MLRAFVLFLALALIAFGAVWIAGRPETLALDWGSYRIETSAAVAGTASARACCAAAAARCSARSSCRRSSASVYVARSRTAAHCSRAATARCNAQGVP